MQKLARTAFDLRYEQLTMEFAVSGDHARRSKAGVTAREVLMLNPDGSWYIK